MKNLLFIFLAFILSAQLDAQTWMPADTGLQSFLAAGKMEEFNGELYVTSSTPWGDFPYYIGKWNGSSWATIPGELKPTSATSSSNHFVNRVGSYNGFLVAVGRFDSIDNVACHNIALWDGLQWTAVDTTRFVEAYLPGYEGQILDAVEYNGDLYIGGSFMFPFGGLAKWNGISWSEVGATSGLGVLNGLVNQLEVIDGKLYVFGSNLVFPATASNVPSIAIWDGADWESVEACSSMDAMIGEKDSVTYYCYSTDYEELYLQDSASGACTTIIPSYQLSSLIGALAKYENEYYFGGWFDPFTGCSGCHYFAKWNGTSFNQVLPNNTGAVEGLKIYNGDLYASGDGSFTPTLLSNVIYLTSSSSVPLSNFYADRVRNVPGDSVLFEYNGKNAVSYEWSFPGGSPSSSTGSSQRVMYNSPGEYTVKLIVSDGVTYDTLIRPSAVVIVNSMTGFHQLQIQMETSLSPNPANGITKVHCADVITTCEVMTADGRRVLSLKPYSKQFSIDLQGWSKGVYSVMCYSDQSSGVAKLVVD